jgi:transcriptional regulator with PAS, ATPase and Fis domain
MRQRGPTTTSRTWTHDGDAGEVAGLSLLVSCASGVSAVHLPHRESLVLGRAADADVVIHDRSVSHQHAALHLEDSLAIEDLGSRNGTRVQGTLAPRGERVPVAIGTVIELGDATLLLERARREVPPSAGDGGGGPALLASGTSAPHLVHDARMKRLYALVDIIAPTSLPVLIMGETGVGKEMYARAMHHRSPRSERPMLTLNCAALPDSILEGEIFGYEKGAFTGATQARPGLFEAAAGGTVFLDEIGELAPGTQAKLLRVLENGEVLRLGARQPTNVDVRLIAATNRDLQALVAQGAFRADLYFRINGMAITLPPLRERKADTRPLAVAFLETAARKLGRKPPRLGDDAATALEAHSWPGNIRELRMVVERAAAFCTASVLTRAHLEALWEAAPAATSEQEPPPSRRTPMPGFRDVVRDLEKKQILEALEACGGNQSRAAKALGIPRRTFVKRLDAYAIARPRKS